MPGEHEGCPLALLPLYVLGLATNRHASPMIGWFDGFLELNYTTSLAGYWLLLGKSIFPYGDTGLSLRQRGRSGGMSSVRSSEYRNCLASLNLPRMAQIDTEKAKNSWYPWRKRLKQVCSEQPRNTYEISMVCCPTQSCSWGSATSLNVPFQSSTTLFGPGAFSLAAFSLARN